MNKFTFISKVFKGLTPHELPIVVNADKGWLAEYPSIALDAGPPAPWYFSLAAHKVTGERPRRGKSYFSTAHLFVLDDVGTKCMEPPTEPSYVLETSPGNFQYGYLLVPYPYPRRFEECMRQLAQCGYTDGGSIDPVHLFRLPGSLHSTGFTAKLHSCNFRRRRQLTAWMREFDIRVPDIREVPHQRKGRKVSEDEVADDAFYSFLLDHGYVTEPMNSSGWISIICPWHWRHSVAEGDDAWMFARYKPGTKIFHCFHEGCAQRTNVDFFTWVSEQRRMLR